MLDDKITPANKLFVRNNGLPPQSVDLAKWRLRIEGPGIQDNILFTRRVEGVF